MSQNVKLYDCESNNYYDLLLSDDDAFKAREDSSYAQDLLLHAKATTIAESSQCSEDIKDIVPIIVSIASNYKGEKASWSFEESVSLISSVETHYEDMHHPRKRKDVWDVISKEMEQAGYTRTAKNCSEKWKNLYRTYKQCKEIKTKSGRGPIRFMYFDQCEAFLSDKMELRNQQVEIQTVPTTESSPWSFNESIALISSIKIHYNEINHPRKRKDVWDVICDDLERSGYNRNPKQCADKWKNLYRTYKSCKETKSNPLRGPIRFMYYEQLDEFIDTKKDILPETNLAPMSILGMPETDTNTEDFDSIDAEEPAEEFLSASKKRKITFSNYFAERAQEWQLRRVEKHAEREKREQRHQEKMILLKQKIEIEKRILDILKAKK